MRAVRSHPAGLPSTTPRACFQQQPHPRRSHQEMWDFSSFSQLTRPTHSASSQPVQPELPAAQPTNEHTSHARFHSQFVQVDERQGRRRRHNRLKCEVKYFWVARPKKYNILMVRVHQRNSIVAALTLLHCSLKVSQSNLSKWSPPITGVDFRGQERVNQQQQRWNFQQLPDSLRENVVPDGSPCSDCLIFVCSQSVLIRGSSFRRPLLALDRTAGMLLQQF